jgi:hypothetical protein
MSLSDTTKEPSVLFDTTVQQIHDKLPDNLKQPRVGIICGSGLSGLAASFRELVRIPYEGLAGFVRSTGKWCKPISEAIPETTTISCRTPKRLSLWIPGFW